MKHIITSMLAVFAIISTASAIQPISDVRIDATSKGESDYGGKGAKTQKRRIEIQLTNTAASKIESASIHWVIYGRDMKDRDLVKIESGEVIKEIPASSTVNLETPWVDMKSQRETKVASLGGRGGRVGRAKVKKIPASGSQYYGYAVMLHEGGKFVASKFSHPSIAELNLPENR